MYNISANFSTCVLRISVTVWHNVMWTTFLYIYIANCYESTIIFYYYAPQKSYVPTYNLNSVSRIYIVMNNDIPKLHVVYSYNFVLYEYTYRCPLGESYPFCFAKLNRKLILSRLLSNIKILYCKIIKLAWHIGCHKLKISRTNPLSLLYGFWPFPSDEYGRTATSHVS